MSRFGSDFKISRSTGQCASSGRVIEPGSPCMAVLCDDPEGGFQRLDYSLEAWSEGDRPDQLFSFWKTRVPEPGERQKVFVDDQVLLDIFERLADDERPQRQAFRYVLGLILIRKRLMRYMGSRQDGADAEERTWWQLRPKGADPDSPFVEVLNPGLGDDDIIELSDQLGDVLQGDL